MGTGILIGMVLDVLLYGMYVLARKLWRSHLPAPLPQPPETAADVANRAAYEADRAHHPQLVSMRLKRRTARGRPWRDQERECNPFD
jgi:hypothetical protein